MRLHDLCTDLFINHYDPSNTRAKKQHMERFQPQIRTVEISGVAPDQLEREWYPYVDW